MSPLLIAAFTGAVGALILRSVLRIFLACVLSARALAKYDCADNPPLGSHGRLLHALGERISDPLATNGWAWLHTSTPQSGHPGNLTVYGPYTNDLGKPGYIRVRFRIAATDFSDSDDLVIILDVMQKPWDLQQAQIVHRQKLIRAKDFRPWWRSSQARSKYRYFRIVCYTTGVGVYEYRALVVAPNANTHRIRFDEIRVYRHYLLWEVM